MGEEILTYEELRKIQRKERINRSLQPINDEFFTKVSAYLNKKKELLENSSDENNRFSIDMSNKIKNELDNAQRVLKDIMERRESKVILQGLMDARAGVSAENVSNMFPFEKKVYQEIFQTITEYRKKCFYPLLTGQMEGEQKEEERDEAFIEVTLLSSLPQFLWKDSNKYGPFEEGEKVEVPPGLAEFLLKQKKAVQSTSMERA